MKRMSITRKNSKQGFTLLDLTIGFALLSISILISTQTFSHNLEIAKKVEQQLSTDKFDPAIRDHISRNVQQFLQNVNPGCGNAQTAFSSQWGASQQLGQALSINQITTANDIPVEVSGVPSTAIYAAFAPQTDHFAARQRCLNNQSFLPGTTNFNAANEDMRLCLKLDPDPILLFDKSSFLKGFGPNESKRQLFLEVYVRFINHITLQPVRCDQLNANPQNHGAEIRYSIFWTSKKKNAGHYLKQRKYLGFAPMQ